MAILQMSPKLLQPNIVSCISHPLKSHIYFPNKHMLKEIDSFYFFLRYYFTCIPFRSLFAQQLCIFFMFALYLFAFDVCVYAFFERYIQMNCMESSSSINYERLQRWTVELNRRGDYRVLILLSERLGGRCCVYCDNKRIIWGNATSVSWAIYVTWCIKSGSRSTDHLERVSVRKLILFGIK